MNCDNLLTVKEISGRVRDKYLRLQAIARYSVGSNKGEPKLKVGVEPIGKGIRTGLASTILVL